MSEIKIDICMLTYNNSNILEETLRNIESIVATKTNIRFLALDNGSTDKTFDILKSFPFVNAYRLEKNRFFTGGANYLFDRCEAVHVFFMSSDVKPRAETFEKIVDFVEANDNIGIVGCKSILRTGVLEFSAKRQPTPLLLHYLHGLPGRVRMLYDMAMDDYLYKKNGFPFPNPKAIDVVQDSFIYINGQLIKNGLRYDTRMKLYYTEDEICFSVRKLGMKIIFFPNAEVEHISQATCNLGSKEISDIYLLDCKEYTLKYFGFFSYLLVALDINITLKLRSFIRKIWPL
jgi:GT2 family glycosyltransferase